MSFSLDSHCLVAISSRRSPHLTGRLQQVRLRGHVIHVSSLVVFELRYGAFGSTDPSSTNARIDRLLGTQFARLDFDDDDAREAGDIRAALKKTGKPIGPYDVLIAGQARRRGLTLVTANVREFKRVRGLKVENWL